MAAPWCTLRIAHSYFADGRAAPLAVRPDAATARRLARCGVSGLALPGGYCLYARDLALAAALDSGPPLLFLITCDDAWLLNYSDIDQQRLSVNGTGGLALGAAVFYADNAAGGTSLAPAFPASARAWRPPQFMWQSAVPLVAATLSVQDRRGRTVWERQTGPAPQSALEIDLRGLPGGAYSLLADGQDQLDFLLGGDGGAKPWGALALFGPVAGEWCWSLQARPTLWRYRISCTRLDLDGWQVQGVSTARTDPPPPLGFAAEALGGTPPCWQFTSATPIALAERPAAWQFHLAQPGARRGGAIALPFARGDSPVAGGAPGLSEIFVFL